jgi:dipeptidyl aminopeptidase/acylaminoacyl peptidase
MFIGDVRILSAPSAGLPPDLELAATLYLPEGADESGAAAGLVVGHGAGSRRLRHDAFCREACTQGFAVLALDFRGHGDSAGAGDGPLEQDIIAAAQYLRWHPAVAGGHVCYRGSSMGGFYGLKAAPEAEFTAMALLCAASEKVMLGAIDEAEETPADTRWDVPRLRAYFEQQDSCRLAARIRCPTLLIHVRTDAVVPFSHSLALAQHLGGDATLRALAEGTHTTAQRDPAIHEFTSRWLLARVRDACTART